MRMNNSEYLQDAINYWRYTDKKDYELFSQKFPLATIENSYSEIDYMNKWCIDNEITYTPTFFINGHQLPPNYGVSDLKYFLSA
ncbi:hypothetical protein DCC81_20505 [Chitinophaga parva]|uniref:Thioredoxin-like fold domain-containing protein n=1 Tax=Chitinophaga parva TaxID=2169414 RepID=A0A2T7BCI0_9BACT|nr:hypothetical protein DCC81_20505 [Chitinophaga parva]